MCDIDSFFFVYPNVQIYINLNTYVQCIVLGSLTLFDYIPWNLASSQQGFQYTGPMRAAQEPGVGETNGSIIAWLVGWLFRTLRLSRQEQSRLRPDQTTICNVRGGDYSELFLGQVVLDAFCHTKNKNIFQNFQN